MSCNATNQKPEQLAGLALTARNYSAFQIMLKTACQRYPDGILFPVDLCIHAFFLHANTAQNPLVQQKRQCIQLDANAYMQTQVQ